MANVLKKFKNVAIPGALALASLAGGCASNTERFAGPNAAPVAAAAQPRCDAYAINRYARGPMGLPTRPAGPATVAFGTVCFNNVAYPNVCHTVQNFAVIEADGREVILPVATEIVRNPVPGLCAAQGLVFGPLGRGLYQSPNQPELRFQ